MADKPGVPGVTEYGRHGMRYQFGKPTAAKMRDQLLNRAKQITPDGKIAAEMDRWRASHAPGDVWHMRAAADTIDDLLLEIVRLGGT